MANSEVLIPIPGRLHSVATAGHVAGADEIYDDNLAKNQETINSEVSTSLGNALFKTSQSLTTAEKDQVSSNLFEKPNTNGMGRVILKATDDFKTVVESATGGNTIFVIQYDFTLTGNVRIPANCVLEFDGGSIANASGNTYSLEGQNTYIGDNEGIFESVNIAGTWIAPIIHSSMFKTDNDILFQISKLISDSIHNEVYIGNCTAHLDNQDNMYDGYYYLGMRIKSNTDIYITGTITATECPSATYQILRVEGDNISINGGTIIGDKDIHTGSTGALGEGIGTWKQSNNVTIKDLQISKCWGDCIDSYSSNTTIEGCTLHDSRRQGVSIGYGDNISIVHNTIYNISGAAPQSGIALEVEDTGNNSHISNVLIENNKIYNCSGSSIQTVSPTEIFIKNNIVGRVIVYDTENIYIKDNVCEGTIDVSSGSTSVYIIGCIATGLILNNSNDIIARDNTFDGTGGFSFVGASFKLLNNIIRHADGALVSNGNGSDTIICKQLFEDNIIEGLRMQFIANTHDSEFVFKKNKIIINTGAIFEQTGSTNGVYDCIFEENEISEKAGRAVSDWLISGLPTGRFCNNKIIYNSNSQNLLLASCGKSDNHFIFQNNTFRIDSSYINQAGFTGGYIDDSKNLKFTNKSLMYPRTIGSTAERPSLNQSCIGYMFYDKSSGINKPIWYDGNPTTGWIDATGTPV